MRFGSPEKKDEILTKLVKENKDGKILESY
jgi:hypothetical protein